MATSIATLVSQRRRDDKKKKIALLRGRHWGQRGKSSKNAVCHGKRHDNKILKVQFWSPRNFLAIAQAPSIPPSWTLLRLRLSLNCHATAFALPIFETHGLLKSDSYVAQKRLKRSEKSHVLATFKLLWLAGATFESLWSHFICVFEFIGALGSARPLPGHNVREQSAESTVDLQSLWPPTEVPNARPWKQPGNSRKGCCFSGVSAVLPAVFRLFYRDPLGTLFGCFSAVSMSGIWHLCRWPQRLQR